MSERARVVYDCNIFWRALFSPSGIGSKCIQLFREGAILHFMSDETLREIREVLKRREVLQKFPSISVSDVDLFIAGILERSAVVTNVPRRFKFPRDPKDEAYIDLAIFVDADYIVTTDNDLLDLMTGYDDASKEFRQRFRDIKIVNPNEFLKITAASDLALLP